MSDAVDFAVENDEDMKIAPEANASGGHRWEEDMSVAATNQFMQQKNSGNIDKARGLGHEYAMLLLDNSSLLTKLVGSSDEISHAILLYSYVVNRVISRHSQDSILARTALNVFYNTIETSSDEIYGYVNDTAAFSLYILCERSEFEIAEKIGSTYASLLGRASEPEAIDRGISLYKAFCEICEARQKEVVYAEVL